MSSEIPLEVIFEILLLLPVSALVRLKVVSKQWRALIDSLTFKKSHLNHHSKKSDYSLILSFPRSANHIDLFSHWNGVPEQLRYPPYVFTNDCMYQFAHCNGVLCLITIGHGHGVLLWNPFIKKHFKVRPPPGQSCRDRYGAIKCRWGFGYDSYLDDFKLVFMSRLDVENGGLGRFRTWVYSGKLGVWKSISDMPYHVWGNGFFASGALHWVARSEKGSPRFIVALDLRNLEYNLVPLPKCLEGLKSETAGFIFGVLDGCLYVHYYSYLSSDFESWVMKEYGVKESWTRLIASTCSERIKRPFAYVENGKKLLFTDIRGVLVGYNFETRSFEKMIRDSEPELIYPHAYTPSLFFPHQSGARAK